MMTLWGGRFSRKLDSAAWILNSSLPFDQRLARQDIQGSIAWAGALHKASVITLEEKNQIVAGLNSVLSEFMDGTFAFDESDEDIHTAVERRLGEKIGALAGKLHTGRSRNDQVATDFRLWILELIPEVDKQILEFQTTILKLAESNLNILMPGYTHLQRAQPVLFSHWILAYFWGLQRDRDRLFDLQKRVSVMPLGSGALAGTSFEIDRLTLSETLGFDNPSQNSMDAVSDRDFAAEFLFCAAMIGVHLSKLCEQMVLFSSSEFGFIELSDEFTTGSSLMPQKKNPDLFEIGRGKSGTLIGYLVGLLSTLKGLPSTYDKDLQEDKVPVFNAADLLLNLVPVLAGALETMILHPDRMMTAIDSSMMATDLADYIVLKGIPFREAHQITGKAVKIAQQNGIGLDKLDLTTWKSLGPFEKDIYAVFDPQNSVNRKKAIGGTAPEAVKQQIVDAKIIQKRISYR
ncbi:MAG: argininosuccinate lyase [Anaerolineaceae bacterium]